MNRSELIAAFQDTVFFSESFALEKETKRAAQSSKVYLEYFESTKRKGGQKGKIIVEENTTFSAAKKYLSKGKTAVLSFANPVTPGGGAQNGAMAQEECLCRSSNLYVCLTAFPFSDYYAYNRSLHSRFYSDRLIYTKGVTVFKDDEDVPQMMPKKEWFQVDVITCAAPYIAKRKYTNRTALKALFKKRIKNIFEAAIENNVEVLILGAFGCGAFKNPPDVVAAAFRETINENYYVDQFAKIVFAIKTTARNAPCPNILAFEREFSVLSAETEKLCFSRKQISILGDSISTLDGYNPKGYNLFYTGSTCDKTGVREMKDTWWGEVINYFGGELLVNNSWSGSRVSRLPNRDTLFPSGCSEERTGGLHINDTMPDMIIVYLGMNDWVYGTEIEERTGDFEEDYTVFATAYRRMLRRLKDNYPIADIYCCTLNETFMSSKPDFRFPHFYKGAYIEEYNSVIRHTAYGMGCGLIDLFSYHTPCDTIDGSHPTADGMHTLAMLMLRGICGR